MLYYISSVAELFIGKVNSQNFQNHQLKDVDFGMRWSMHIHCTHIQQSARHHPILIM